jgi:tetrahydromethanopterin S-methyltransferase subunit H
VFRFEREQSVFDIAGVKVGGQPGEYPTVLIGSIFYERHKIVSDPLKGKFNEGAAESLIKKQEELYDKTGNPFILDVVGLTSVALIKYVEFVSEITEAPFLVDGPSAHVRVPAIEHAIEVGLRDRTIYNSIDYHVKPEEISMLKELGVESSVLMAYNPRNVWPEGRLEILKGYEGQVGLLEVAEKAGIENLLVDTAVFDVPSIGHAAKAIHLVKSRYGLPAGCAPSNAVTTWKRVKKEYVPYAYPSCLAGSSIITMMMGANFVLYGSIEFAEVVYPSCAMADAIIAYAARKLGTQPKVKNHPLFKIF